MNSGLCLHSGINRRSVGLFIVVSLSEPRRWQGNLPSCPHMPSLYLGHFSALCSILPKQTFHFLEGLRSARSQSPSGSLPVHFDCSLGQGGAGRGAAPGLVTDVNLSLALRLDQEVSALPPSSPAVQLDCEWTHACLRYAKCESSTLDSFSESLIMLS